ncbi:MAG: sugar transferase [Acidobacteria bacterium]|nr:MAG: sugar transferase [Acidobacteriota bacterium]
MSTIRRNLLLSLVKAVDLVMMVASFFLATSLTMHESTITLSTFLSIRIKVANVLLFLALLPVWHIVLSGFGLYNSRRMSNRKADVLDAVGATTAGTILIAAVLLLFRVKMITADFLMVFWASTTAIAASQRVLQRALLERIRRHGRNLRQMLILGTNSRALGFARQIETRPELGYRIIGFVDQEWNGLSAFNGSGLPIVADFLTLPDFLRKNVVDEVVIALPMGSLHTWAAKIATLCEQQGITTRFLSNIFDLKLSQTEMDEVEGTPLITHYTGTTEGWPLFMKDGIDIVGSAILLVLLLPIMLVVAVLIKLTSSGPVLFSQRRLGYNKRVFEIYKFRTMVVDAEQRMKDLEHLNEVSGPVFKMKNDPRITPIGRFLRKTSLDELPQLFNVLKRDMSLVGPRPLPSRDYEGFANDWQRRRFTVRPGLTCLWQVNGRSSISFDKWMQLDLQYIDKWSLWLDFKILIKTIPAVLKGSGAA